MSDYYVTTGISRDQMAEMLSDNEEQFLYVLSAALDRVAADDVIELGELAPDIDAELVVHNLRSIADAITNGQVS